MRLAPVLLSIAWLTGCTGKRDGGETTTNVADAPAEASREPDADASGPERFSEPARQRLLVLAHESTAAEGKLRAIELASLSVGEPLTIPALPIENWPDHFGVVAAHGGGDRFVVAGGGASAWTVERRSVGTDPSVTVEIGEQRAAALHMAGEQVFVGQGNRVLTVDFGSAAAPVVDELRHRPEMKFKAYDLFARDGGWLVAIDDQVTPVYADSFELSDDAARHRADFELPGAINGIYQFALLRASGPGVGTLYSIIPYGIMSGSGHDLVALPMRDAAPAVDTADLIVNRGGAVAIPVLEEHVPRGDIGELQVLAGDRYTDWTGLAHVELDGGGRLLIAAGDRGLLMLTDEFTAATRPTMLDVGGACLDVFVDGQRVFVLRGPLGPSEGQPLASALVELSLGDDTTTPSEVIELDGPYRSFVR